MTDIYFAPAGDSNLAYFANPAKLNKAALTGETIEVVVRVPLGQFSKAWNDLRPLLDDGTPFLEDWFGRGRSEEELRICFGVLDALTDELPLDTAHYLQWLERCGVDQYLDAFAERRCKLNGRSQVAA